MQMMPRSLCRLNLVIYLRIGKLTTRLSSVQRWKDGVRLKLNTDKTKCIIKNVTEMPLIPGFLSLYLEQ